MLRCGVRLDLRQALHGIVSGISSQHWDLSQPPMQQSRYNRSLCNQSPQIAIAYHHDPAIVILLLDMSSILGLLVLLQCWQDDAWSRVHWDAIMHGLLVLAGGWMMHATS